MVFYDEAEVRKLYERYKLQWMVYHGLGLVDLMDCMEAMIQEDMASSEPVPSCKSCLRPGSLMLDSPAVRCGPAMMSTGITSTERVLEMPAC